MLRDVGRALTQMGDPAFIWVLVKSLLLTILLLMVLGYGIFTLVGWWLPDVILIPFLGELDLTVAWISWAGMGVLMVASVFLMIPVASLFVGIFVDEVAAAVERRHYPHLPEGRAQGIGEIIVDSLQFLGLLIFANLALLIVYFLANVFAPFIFWAVNGFLLAREYFHLVALRRMEPAEARALRRHHLGQIWLLGMVMAVPLTIPVVNLFVPLLGVAAFTHQFHRLTAKV